VQRSMYSMGRLGSVWALDRLTLSRTHMIPSIEWADCHSDGVWFLPENTKISLCLTACMRSVDCLIPLISSQLSGTRHEKGQGVQCAFTVSFQ